MDLTRRLNHFIVHYQLAWHSYCSDYAILMWKKALKISLKKS